MSHATELQRHRRDLKQRAEQHRQQDAPDYATIRAQRLAAENVCSEPGCPDPVVAKYGRDEWNGAEMEFTIKARYCARHDAPFREGRIVVERT